jgi:excisionase family DNA binding protein
MNPPENNNTPGHSPVSGEVITPPETLEADSDLWTTVRVSKYLQVSLKTVFNLRKKGLPYVQVGGAVRFDPQEIKDYLINSRRLSSHRLRQMIRNGAST